MKYYYLKRHRGIFKYFRKGHTLYGYRFTYYDDQHKRHENSKRGFSSVNDAAQAYNEINELKGASQHHQSLTVKAWCLHYINMIKPPIRKITTYKSYHNLLIRHVIPTIGNYKLNQIQLDTYQNRCLNYLLKQGLSRTTVTEVNSRVQAIMNYAVKTKYLKINPLKFATVPNVNVKPKREIMSTAQLHTFNKNLLTHSLLYQVIYFTLEETGIRVGELLGLHYNDLDLTKRIMNIRFTRDTYGIRKPKTPHSKRKLMIPKSLNRLLQKYAIYCKKHYKLNSHSLIIRGKHGKPLIPKTVPVELKRLLIEVGLKSLVGRFVPHSFRHMFASRLINQGVSIITVSKMLGHANPDITLKIYANAVPNSIPDISKFMK